MEPVTLENYAARAYAFRNHDLKPSDVAAMMALGLVGELLEMKHAPSKHLPAELGAVYWHFAGLCTISGLDFATLMKDAASAKSMHDQLWFGGLCDRALNAACHIVNYIKKLLYYYRDPDNEHLVRQLMILAEALDKIRWNHTDRLCVEDILQENIEKLTARYPGGKFSSERSEIREEDGDET